VNVTGATLFTTTFPCHNCAKHIVSAGITRVVYIEPYPKSMAGALFGDTISIDQPVTGRVGFSPFVGVGPRRYFDLFSLKLGSGYPIKRKDDYGNVLSWRSEGAKPRTSFGPSSYIERETMALKALVKPKVRNRRRPMPTRQGKSQS
jgi:hypothetical protein